MALLALGANAPFGSFNPEPTATEIADFRRRRWLRVKRLATKAGRAQRMNAPLQGRSNEICLNHSLPSAAVPCRSCACLSRSQRSRHARRRRGRTRFAWRTSIASRHEWRSLTGFMQSAGWRGLRWIIRPWPRRRWSSSFRLRVKTPRGADVKRAQLELKDLQMILDGAVAEMTALLRDPSLAPNARRFETGGVETRGLTFVGSRVDAAGTARSRAGFLLRLRAFHPGPKGHAAVAGVWRQYHPD